MDQRFLRRLLDMVAVPNCQCDQPAHTLLLPKRCTNLLQ